MSAIHVKPVGDARVRNPARDFAVLPQAGDVVPDSLFWRRREIAGEIVIGEPSAAPAAPHEPAPVAETADDSSSQDPSS